MDLITRAAGEHPYGYTALSDMQGVHAEMLMDFGVLRLRRGETWTETQPLEKAYLLVSGKVRFSWENQQHEEERANCFDVPPTALHVCRSVSVTLECLSEECEIDILRTDNEREFPSRLYLPGDTPDEFRGAGTMHETSTRIVRTIFDDRNAPYANLVLGEVIGFPGKWSSYPPHHHPQPEIYYYKNRPENGFGYAEVGENVYKVHNGDTVCIPAGMTHPQCTPPGYALWYLWGIRHLENARYGTPTFVPEHLWVQAPGQPYWGDDKHA